MVEQANFNRIERFRRFLDRVGEGVLSFSLGPDYVPTPSSPVHEVAAEAFESLAEERCAEIRDQLSNH